MFIRRLLSCRLSFISNKKRAEKRREGKIREEKGREEKGREEKGREEKKREGKMQLGICYVLTLMLFLGLFVMAGD